MEGQKATASGRQFADQDQIENVLIFLSSLAMSFEVIWNRF
jgi:hypothetical protein